MVALRESLHERDGLVVFGSYPTVDILDDHEGWEYESSPGGSAGEVDNIRFRGGREPACRPVGASAYLK